MRSGKPISRLAAVLLASAVAPLSARAVMFISTGDPNVNTTAPTDPTYAGSGWQFQGDWAGFSATPIGIHYFLTAKHIGGSVGGAITYNGDNYTTVSSTDITGTDLRVWKISGTFPTYPLVYNPAADGLETAKTLVAIGRGTDRGAEIRLPESTGDVRGWQWGADNRVRRWGTNIVAAIDDLNTLGDGKLLQFDFDQSGGGYSGTYEAGVTGGDSGGGIFVKSGSQWKLAGIIWAVDGPFSYTATGPTFVAPLFDAGGFYFRGGSTPQLIPDLPQDIPTSAYASRVGGNLTALAPFISPTWSVDVSGNWSTNGNWSGNVPDATDAEANFRSIISSPRTVTVDGDKTVGYLYFDNANRYSLSGSASLTLSTSGGAASVNVLSGSHTISAPVVLASDTVLTVNSAADTLTISSDLTASGFNVIKQGPGTIEIKNVQGAGLLHITAGSVKVLPDGTSAATSKLNSLLIDTGTLDLSNNHLVVDYISASPSASIRSYLIAGRGAVGVANGESWAGSSGITSSAAANVDPTGLAVGYREAQPPNFDIDAFTTFGGQTVDDTAILIRYTYAGDANLDGKVDRDDLNILSNSFGQTSDVDWLHGDFDYNGTCDRDDFNLLSNNFGSDPIPSPPALTAMLGADSRLFYQMHYLARNSVKFSRNLNS